MLTSDPASMSAYASLYPGVDHFPTRLPRLDRYGHAWCYCGVKNGGAVAGDGQCDDCRASYAPGHPCAHPARYGHGSVVWSCGCGQLHAVHLAGDGSQVPPNLCPSCKAKAREPQGEAMRLFSPAPNQLAGQLTL
jgi:hypothetical protein